MAFAYPAGFAPWKEGQGTAHLLKALLRRTRPVGEGLSCVDKKATKETVPAFLFCCIARFVGEAICFPIHGRQIAAPTRDPEKIRRSLERRSSCFGTVLRCSVATRGNKTRAHAKLSVKQQNVFST
jgi:hypothetical protein